MIIEDLTTLDATEVQQNITKLKAMVQELNPNLDWRVGPLGSAVLQPLATVYTAIMTNLELWRQSSTLYGISQNPALADQETVDAVMSNYLLSRSSGAKSSGYVLFVMSAATELVVKSGTTLSANGKSYVVPASYSARADVNNVLLSTDRPIVQLDSTTYGFFVDLIAADVGTDYKLTSGQTLTSSVTYPTVLQIVVVDDFTDGEDVTTTQKLLDQVNLGLSAKTLSGTSQMMSLLNSIYPGVSSQTIIGMADEELSRDKRSLFPVTPGGMVDWYVRSGLLPDTKVIEKTAVIVEKPSSLEATLQFTLTATEAPAAYEVSRIIKAGELNVQGSKQITGSTVQFDFADFDSYPVLSSPEEIAFTAFQSLTVQFEDEATYLSELEVGDTVTYSVYVKIPRDIRSMQQYVSSANNSTSAGDVLIKAAIPVFLKVSFNLLPPAGSVLPDLDNIRLAVASRINQLGLGDTITGSMILTEVHQFLDDAAGVDRLSMFCKTISPSRNEIRKVYTDLIEVAEDPYVTARTSCVYLDPQDVVITVNGV